MKWWMIKRHLAGGKSDMNLQQSLNKNHPRLLRRQDMNNVVAWYLTKNCKYNRLISTLRPGYCCADNK
jgi:hypothetical protein